MSFIARLLLFCVICLVIVPTVLARKPVAQTGVSVGGIYENFTVGKESGDLEGMRVVIVAAGGGYHAIVQIAEGGVGDPKPVFVPVTVKGRNVRFSVGEQKFTGTVSAAGLTLKEDGGSQVLKRKPCASYFKSLP